MRFQLDLTKEYGIVLEGGGARGSYQIGAWKALREAGIKIRGIAGASVGALNGALICMDDLEKAEKIWENIRYSQVMDVDDTVIETVKNLDLKKIPVGYKQDLKIGPASVLCCTDGEVKEYAAEITRIDMNHEDSNKSFVIQITDKELLEKTGGIVQGMSGSPVLQNGKLFGAVTHVFVQDSTGGYGIFIENMTGNV